MSLGIDAASIINFHRYMLADEGRTASYRKAIAETVRPGDVVVDIGTGTGILAFFACQAGARRVYAVEVGPAIELARQVCAQNGLQDRVVFLNDLSFSAVLPERVDVIISEILGSVGLQGGILGLMIDARRRMLKEGGRLVPQTIELYVVPVEAPAEQRRIDLWKQGLWGFDFSSIRPFAVNNYYNFTCDPKSLLSAPASLGRIALSHIESPYVRGAASTVATRAGVLHGIACWVSLGLSERINISNSPGDADVRWSQAFFPLATPVPVSGGEEISAVLSTHDGAEWRWRVKVRRPIEDQQGTGTQDVQFDHSSFLGFPMTNQSLRARATPKLSPKGEAELFLLSLLNGKKTVAELEEELTSRFGDRFPSRAAISAFLREIVRRNS